MRGGCAAERARNGPYTKVVRQREQTRAEVARDGTSSASVSVSTVQVLVSGVAGGPLETTSSVEDLRVKVTYHQTIRTCCAKNLKA